MRGQEFRQVTERQVTERQVTERSTAQWVSGKSRQNFICRKVPVLDLGDEPSVQIAAWDTGPLKLKNLHLAFEE